MYREVFPRNTRMEINETKSTDHPPCSALHFGVCGLFDRLRFKMHVDQILAEWAASLWAKLGVNGITALLMLTALYFIVKWAVKNGVKAAFQEMKETEATK